MEPSRAHQEAAWRTAWVQRAEYFRTSQWRLPPPWQGRDTWENMGPGVRGLGIAFNSFKVLALRP